MDITIGSDTINISCIPPFFGLSLKNFIVIQKVENFSILVAIFLKGKNLSQSVSIKLFEDRNVRTLWDEETEEWYFSVHDVIAILTNQPDYEKVRNYWKWLRNKLKQEGSELGSDTTQLKLQAADF